MSEIQLQADCTIWFQNTMREYRGRFRRVKNETDNFTTNTRSRIAQGVMNRTTGVVAGTWDAFLVVEPIVWIEFKYGHNGLSPEQVKFMEIGKSLGWRFHVVKTLPEFQNVVNLYFK